VLAGGAKERELTAAELRVGSLILVEGELHPSHADQPPGMEVDRWEKVEPASPRDQGRQVDDPESTDRRAN